MRPLTAGDFQAYFKAVHGHVPFPWQERLLLQVVRERRWPSLLDLPTGAGKTAAMDVAVFHLALDAAQGWANISAPRRIVMIVDRRTVVDQGFERAKKIADKLAGASEGVLFDVAERLRSLGGAGSPLAVAQLRGGMPRDDAWAERPDQPVIAVSTVDQVGSRLLFRGYGVSDGMRPVHAGLLGNDVLLILDEVHLSDPFRRTLESVERYRTWPRGGGAVRARSPQGDAVSTQPLPDRWQFVQMSATPGGASDFGLAEEDRRDERLARRLRASKPVEAHEVKVSGGAAAKRATFAAECAARAVGLAKHGRRVGVVVNRVATAREIAALIQGEGRLPAGSQVFLVTGRMRPVDRDDLDAKITPLLRSGRERRADLAPVIVVATQCIEAGADFDFDALVTECASLDALRQRFGRLNRLGELEDTDAAGARSPDAARAVVLVASDALAKDATDPIYGDALARTWHWLKQETRDLGIDAIEPAITALREQREDGPEGGRLAIEALLAPKERAPVMLPAHLDMWAQTKPAPFPDPDVALWLHGIRRKPRPEVQIVWRGDVSEQAILRAAEDTSILEALTRRIEACPPVGLEALSVPIDAARAWLRGDEAPDLGDVEGIGEEEEERRRREARRGRPALLWRGEETEVLQAEDVRPEQTIVVPCTYGGIGPFGSWDPTSKEPVPDIGDRARFQQTRRPTLRLHPAIVARAEWAKAPSAPDAEEPALEDSESTDDAIAAMTGDSEKAPWLCEALRGFSGGRKSKWTHVRIDPIAWEDERGKQRTEPGYLALIARLQVRPARGGEAHGDATTEGDNGSHTGVKVSLREHLAGVESWARAFAERCGLSDSLARSVAVAGAWHDAGKVDPRFQRLLRGGGDSRALTGEPLAKSDIVLADRAARRRAMERSGYPRGARHELASVALLREHTGMLGDGVDIDLVLHLIASHHGYCRPFAPVVRDEAPQELTFDANGTQVTASSAHGLEKLDSGVADRFWTLVNRYGWFGLAWLEAILRLADHRRSEEEQRQKTGADQGGAEGET